MLLSAPNLVCHDCENLFGKLDKKAADILRNKHTKTETKKAGIIYHQDFGRPINVETIDNFNFLDLQKFIFSVLIRGHIWHSKIGQSLLGDKHFKKIRELLRSEIVDDETYPIHLMKTTGIGFNFIPFKMRSPQNHWMQLFHGHSLLFIIYTSSHKKSEDIMLCRIRKDEPAYIPEYESGTILGALEKAMARARKENAHLFKPKP